jgi:hypothetical protein
MQGKTWAVASITLVLLTGCSRKPAAFGSQAAKSACTSFLADYKTNSLLADSNGEGAAAEVENMTHLDAASDRTLKTDAAKVWSAATAASKVWADNAVAQQPDTSSLISTIATPSATVGNALADLYKGNAPAASGPIPSLASVEEPLKQVFTDCGGQP